MLKLQTRGQRLALALIVLWAFVGGLIAFAQTLDEASAARQLRIGDCGYDYVTCQSMGDRAYQQIADGFWLTAVGWIVLPIALGIALVGVGRWIAGGGRTTSG